MPSLLDPDYQFGAPPPPTRSTDLLGQPLDLAENNGIQQVGDVVPFPRRYTIQPIGPDSDPSLVPGTPEYNLRMEQLLEKLKGMYRGSRGGDGT